MAQHRINTQENSEVFFKRAPHDKKNPYVMISQELINDKNISPECRFLLIYLLSNKNRFKININNIVSCNEITWGRTKVTRLINEAIEARYITREIKRDTNGSYESLEYKVLDGMVPPNTNNNNYKEPV